jgi:bacillithiol synthase
MEKLQINRKKLSIFSNLSNLLSYHQDRLLDFIEEPFHIEAFGRQINRKKGSFSTEDRSVLCDVLNEKYKTIEAHPKVKQNLALLSLENSFTVTTGHQLSIFTGPIYFIYKILHTIRLSEELAKNYPNNHFVPIFWMASEDHDFEEIQSVKVFNKELKWETTQSGAVGRFDFASFEFLKGEFKELFQQAESEEIQNLLDAYQGTHLGEATFNLVNFLFEHKGLVILDGDHPILKKRFVPTIKKEIESQFSFEKVKEKDELLSQAGHKSQVFAREINLFYLQDGIRSRIKMEDNTFVIDEVGKFSQSELLKMVDEHPENFSPNVILRPLYQETILPNLCYLGGGGEMAYWLQLKGVFDAAFVPYPLIQVRNSFLHVDGPTKKKMDNFSFSIEEWMGDTQDLKNQFLSENDGDAIDFTALSPILDQLETFFTEKTDSGNASWVGAELRKIEKQIESLKQRLIKEAKKKHETQINQIDQIQAKFFPNRVFQERAINFFSLCKDGQVHQRINSLYELIEPFGNDLVVFSC